MSFQESADVAPSLNSEVTPIEKHEAQADVPDSEQKSLQSINEKVKTLNIGFIRNSFELSEIIELKNGDKNVEYWLSQ